MFSAALLHSLTVIGCHRINPDARNICIFHIFFPARLPNSIDIARKHGGQSRGIGGKFLFRLDSKEQWRLSFRYAILCRTDICDLGLKAERDHENLTGTTHAGIWTRRDRWSGIQRLRRRWGEERSLVDGISDCWVGPPGCHRGGLLEPSNDCEDADTIPGQVYPVAPSSTSGRRDILSEYRCSVGIFNSVHSLFNSTPVAHCRQ